MAKKSKPVTKKKAIKAPAKKAVVKKKAAVKKNSKAAKKSVIKKKSVISVHKPAARTIKKKISGKLVVAPQIEAAEIDAPPVKETSPEINNDLVTPAEGIVTKSTQRITTRHYDNHQIRLSGKKGGYKPSGKKPLW